MRAMSRPSITFIVRIWNTGGGDAPQANPGKPIAGLAARRGVAGTPQEWEVLAENRKSDALLSEATDYRCSFADVGRVGPTLVDYNSHGRDAHATKMASSRTACYPRLNALDDSS